MREYCRMALRRSCDLARTTGTMCGARVSLMPTTRRGNGFGILRSGSQPGTRSGVRFAATPVTRQCQIYRIRYRRRRHVVDVVGVGSVPQTGERCRLCPGMRRLTTGDQSDSSRSSRQANQIGVLAPKRFSTEAWSSLGSGRPDPALSPTVAGLHLRRCSSPRRRHSSGGLIGKRSLVL